MGHNPAFKDAVTALGKGLAERELPLVYGGGSLGLMGVLASAVKQYGGTVIGIITQHLVDQEKPFAQLDELYIVETMYERKQLIHNTASRFIIMPGGLGTFDELFETWCAITIGVINKPIGFVNVDGFFDSLFQFVGSCKDHGFLDHTHLKRPTIYPDVSVCLEDLKAIDCSVS